MARILIVDDDEAFREGLAETVRDLGHTAIEAGSCASGLAALDRDPADLVILDHRLGDADGLEFLRRLSARPQTRPVVVMLTAFATTAGTVEAMKLGAFDHLMKPVRRDDLTQTIERALRAAIGRTGTGESVAASADEVIGASGPMREALKLIGLAAGNNATVLLAGETGSGKEVLARLLHRSGPRADGPFVAINCAAIPEDLLESELFGHVKGAFTGAVADRRGCFRQAQGGTLLLDEIGEMPAAMQAKLLRVLEDHRYTPVGAAREEQADVRLVAATHRDLSARVRDGGFREDLYHRLNVLQIRVPPLRERPQDILPLAEHFLARFSQPVKRLSADAAPALQSHVWPGNVRELRNLIERACVVVRGAMITAEDVAGFLNPPLEDEAVTARILQMPLPEAVASLERAMIRRALLDCNGNRAEAARRLGIRRQLLYAKLTELGLD